MVEPVSKCENTLEYEQRHTDGPRDGQTLHSSTRTIRHRSTRRRWSICTWEALT